MAIWNQWFFSRKTCSDQWCAFRQRNRYKCDLRDLPYKWSLFRTSELRGLFDTEHIPGRVWHFIPGRQVSHFSIWEYSLCIPINRLFERASLSLSIHCSGRDAKRAERACTHLCPATELAGARVALLRCPILPWVGPLYSKLLRYKKQARSLLCKDHRRFEFLHNSKQFSKLKREV